MAHWKVGDLAASTADYQEDLRTVLGEDLRHLVVDDNGELRLLHPFVAEHVLAAALEPGGERRWESRLADTAVEFIGKVCGHLGSDNAQTRRILQDLFIRRNQWSGGSSPSAARFAELIHQVPVRDEAYRIFKELTRKCPSEPHFWNHMGRYHIHEMKYDYPNAQEYLLKAIELSGRKDSLHFHSLGMVHRLWVKHELAKEASDTGRTQEALDAIHDIYQGALDAFADGRRLDSEDEHSYVTPVQMIVDVLNHMVRISPYENFLDLVRHGGDVGGWADEQLRVAEGLLDQLDMALPGHRRSSYHNTCERQLQTLHGNIASLVSQWRSLVTESRSHSGAALVLARAFFREQQQELSSVATEAFRSVVELYDSVFDNRGDLSDSDMRTWFRCYRKLEEYDELDALQRFAVIADYRNTSQEAHYYLYVLRFMRWLRNEEQNQQEVERYVTDSKRLARDGRRQYSYEWVGVGAPAEDGRQAPPRLVHFTELGERRPEPELWEHSDKLLRMTGVIKEIEGPQSGWITVGDGRMGAFFVPKDKFRRHSDINQLVEFYLGFSYEGLRAWSVDFAAPAAASRRPVPAPRSKPAAPPSAAVRTDVVPRRPVVPRPDVSRPEPPKPGAERPVALRPPAPAASADFRSRAKELARTNEEEAYRFLVRSMLSEGPDTDAVTSLRLGALLQETFGRQSYARVLGVANCEVCSCVSDSVSRTPSTDSSRWWVKRWRSSPTSRGRSAPAGPGTGRGGQQPPHQLGRAHGGVGAAVVEEHVQFVGLCGGAAQPGYPGAQFGGGVVVPEAVLLASPPHAWLRPWKRTTARDRRVTGTTGGRDDGRPWAMSVPTAEAPSADSRAWVASARSASHHPGCRNSTAIGQPSVRPAHASSAASAGEPGANHGGNWNSTVPSRPSLRSGSTASAKRPHTSSSRPSPACPRRSRPPSAPRRSAGSASGRVGWPVSRENALTSKRKPSGVRSSHSSLLRRLGSA